MGNELKKISEDVRSLGRDKNEGLVRWSANEKKMKPEPASKVIDVVTIGLDGKLSQQAFCLFTVESNSIVKYIRADLVQGTEDEDKVVLRFQILTNKPRIPYLFGTFKVRECITCKDLDGFSKRYLKKYGIKYELSSNDSGVYAKFLVECVKIK